MTNNFRISIQLQLGISSLIVIGAGFLYGANPSVLFPIVFGFDVEHLDLKNILRAIMGLYVAFGSYWMFGVFKSKHTYFALISNVLFMAGLAFGRLVSTFIDGVSAPFIVGLLLECIFLCWGWYNLKAYKLSKET